MTQRQNAVTDLRRASVERRSVGASSGLTVDLVTAAENTGGVVIHWAGLTVGDAGGYAQVIVGNDMIGGTQRGARSWGLRDMILPAGTSLSLRNAGGSGGVLTAFVEVLT